MEYSLYPKIKDNIATTFWPSDSVFTDLYIGEAEGPSLLLTLNSKEKFSIFATYFFKKAIISSILLSLIRFSKIS